VTEGGCSRTKALRSNSVGDLSSPSKGNAPAQGDLIRPHKAELLANTATVLGAKSHLITGFSRGGEVLLQGLKIIVGGVVGMGNA